MKPSTRDLVGAALFFVLGGVVAVVAAQLPMGGVRLPGSGAFPIVIGIAMIVLATSLALQRTLPPNSVSSSDEIDEPEQWGNARVALVCALIAAFVLLLPVAGFPLGGALLMIALYVIGAGRLGVGSVAAGVVTALVAYALFVLLLDVPLPRGSLWGF
ncbi:tripartite tricarboxylate transporter TctB family protein [Bradyrhizobium sp. LHD-71]|uniref:tripartite tricarboxylate transporter TctB family protein n=1 Tax=Bradyrhizobium sp. LHD-71 TaxID=3072141 RepID=UPI00280D4045|nr:tripartite tricarboxylate transporter TctB family protein [Bradyrhizobium sp. LHD-71]MDQ8727512.1 tripartite tricarboxylate transporter TctB family protein [Bradyrhizobium sp. LHD-71]